MTTVILSEYNILTEDKHIFAHGIHSGEALQYYGGDTGCLFVGLLTITAASRANV